MNKKMGTLLKKAEDVIGKIGLNIAFTENGVMKDSELLDHSKLGNIMKKEYQKYYASWTKNALHGKVLTRCIEGGIDIRESFRWLNTARLRGDAVSTLFAIQEQAIPTRVIKKRIWKNNILSSEYCRMCDKSLETVSHVISGCTVLANTYYKARHDNMLKVIYYYLLFKLGFEEKWHAWYEVNIIEPVKSNEVCSIYWDYPLQTNNFQRFNKPDIVIIYKQQDKISLIEGSVPWDENIASKQIEKRNKYKELSIELKNIHRKKICTISEVVIGSTGLLDESIKKSLKPLCDNSKDVRRIMDYCQKAVILGTVRICRQLFDSVM